MVEEKIIDYIKTNLAKGYNKEQVKQTLLKSGYSEEVINEHFGYLEKGPEKGEEIEYPPKVPEEAKPKRIKLIGLFLILIIVLGAGAYYFSTSFFKPYEIPVTPPEEIPLEEDILPEEIPPEEVIPEEATAEQVPPTEPEETYEYDYVLCRALADNDVSFCENLEEPSKGACEEEFCLYDLMSGSLSSYCEGITFTEFKFWADLFRPPQKDEAVCNQLEDSVEIAICKSVVTDDMGKCDALTEDDRIGCEVEYKQIKAVQNNNIELCQELPEEALSIESKAFCLAVLTRDKASCEIGLGLLDATPPG